MLLYLAEKYDFGIPKSPQDRTEMMNWLFWLQGCAPVLGGMFGHFYNYAPLNIEYAVDRASLETLKLFDLLNRHLEDKEFIVGDSPTIADYAIVPWFSAILSGKAYKDSDVFLGLSKFKNVSRYCEKFTSRPSYQRGRRVNGFGDDAVKELHSRQDFNQEKKDLKNAL